MKREIILGMTGFLVLCTLACSGFPALVPTETPVPTPTLTPTETPQPTATLTPTEVSPTPEEEFFMTLPESEPLSDWQGIPIMPGAIKGDESETGEAYYFTIKTTRDEIQAYYEQEMPGVGYQPFAIGDGDGEAVLMMFMGGEGMITISIFEVNEAEGLFYVMLLYT